MFNIEINNKTYKGFSSLSEMSFKRTRLIFGLLKEKQDLETKQEIVSLFTDIPSEIILCLKEEDADKLISRLNLNIFKILMPLQIDDKVFDIIDFDKLTVEEYGEIEYFLLNYPNEYEVLNKIVNLIYKEVNKNHKNILYNMKLKLFFKNIVPYKLDKIIFKKEQTNNEELFDNRLDGAIGLGIYNAFNEWRFKLAKEYPDIWGTQDKTDEDEEIYEYKSIFYKWGIYSQVWTLSNSLIERDAWHKKNIRDFLKALSYYIILQEEEKIKNRANG
jgi:hypothetical protein